VDEARTRELLRLAWHGETEAFADVYRAFFPRVFGLCRRLLGSPEAAEDATSEVFLRAQRNLRGYDLGLPFAPWLFGIASHYCLDQLRRRRAEQRLFEAPDRRGGRAAGRKGAPPRGRLSPPPREGAPAGPPRPSRTR